MRRLGTQLHETVKLLRGTIGLALVGEREQRYSGNPVTQALLPTGAQVSPIYQMVIRDPTQEQRQVFKLEGEKDDVYFK